ncbi:50S ribosomal protein L3 [candidate division WOR-1 bacterium RIFOXYD2_FULL_36_8]|uniref:Large ribosomal subunit protein uL3 n=1 Tax=candidate division WOR-1 bacterium RIFOXYB2_FULL_36_35 TaxID=1802578 RepID=A0A1F4S522_UNCSA|nr:MAG: 50S ribosomal protein L3 [candidate division WOR-1 bacterium RIFOXYA2_FULL_36_21]OGC15532.1 MAG: 50S ribosomal protein L3 [candidate division WOR-1 bacterium RIFOXYB2_FULL_36_35]OGC21317.1 MAG: 50S ribosomal protein L3 [candidate division WOR-1 bacterium RIFOXYA12_FULL_36_13]OGC38387.1 MAG: 50S ribosomal protein L3 [candidate division WOR-1 bacterium RIFOXYD2_FULL_36_8]
MSTKGLLAKKIGMTQIFNDRGDVVGVTVLEAANCRVVGIRTKVKDGYNAIQLGFMLAKKLNKPLTGFLKENKLKHIVEFSIENVDEYKIGQEIKVDVFNIGDMVNIAGIGIGKGFAGTTKRWHHHRGPMTHGSKSHRLTGSIGAGTTPGRVYKGLNMPGHMGAKRVTNRKVKIVSVDTEKNLLLVKGSVPGPKGNIVEIVKI